MLVINCKNYAEVSTAPRLKRLATYAAEISGRYKVAIAIAPPQHLLGHAASEASVIKSTKGSSGPKFKSNVVILAQHADCADIGSTTGYVVPEMLKKAGVAGSMINHSEHRVKPDEIKCMVARLGSLGMMSVLCVKNVAEAKKYAKFCPDYIAIEPPELIGSGRAVSTENPGIISDASDAIAKAAGASKVKLLCGAGISSGADVSRAAELGAAGILVASGVIKNPSRWKGIISGMARPLQSG